MEAKDRKKFSWIAPDPVHPPARPLRPVGKGGDVEFPTGLRMDGFALRKSEAAASDRNDLRLAAHEVHLDRGLTLVPTRLVRKRVDSKIALEFTIDAPKKVEIELGSDAAPIIVCVD